MFGLPPTTTYYSEAGSVPEDKLITKIQIPIIKVKNEPKVNRLADTTKKWVVKTLAETDGHIHSGRLDLEKEEKKAIRT